MAKNLVQEGRYLTLPTSAETSTTAGVGDVFFFGTHGYGVVVSKGDDNVVIDTQGVWALKKKKADVLVVGGIAYWDHAIKSVEKASAAKGKAIGVIVGGTELAATKDGLVYVKIDQVGAATA